jgi:hypothetical protein
VNQAPVPGHGIGPVEQHQTGIPAPFTGSWICHSSLGFNTWFDVEAEGLRTPFAPCNQKVASVASQVQFFGDAQGGHNWSSQTTMASSESLRKIRQPSADEGGGGDGGLGGGGDGGLGGGGGKDRRSSDKYINAAEAHDTIRPQKNIALAFMSFFLTSMSSKAYSAEAWCYAVPSDMNAPSLTPISEHLCNLAGRGNARLRQHSSGS